MRTVGIFLILCLGQASWASKKNCEGSLYARPDRKTLGVGARLKLKAKLKASDLVAGALVQVPTDALYIHRSLEVGTGGWRILPQTELKTLSTYKKIHNISVIEVEIPEAEIRGYMYWTDLYRNALVIEPGAEVETKPKKVRAM